VIGGGLAGEDEDTGADDGADTQQDEMFGGQYALQRDFTLQRSVDRFACIDVW